MTNTELTYRGQPVPVLSAPPQWSDRIAAGPVYRTLISESLAGHEDRLQRRPRPLWSESYQAITRTARETGYVRGVMFAAKQMPVAVPLWPHEILLSAEAQQGTATLAHESAAGTRLGNPGPWALLYAHAVLWEVVRLTASAEFSSDTAVDLVNTWPAGSRLYPLLAGHLPRPETEHRTDELGLWRVDFEERFLPLGEEAA